MNGVDHRDTDTSSHLILIKAPLNATILSPSHNYMLLNWIIEVPVSYLLWVDRS